MERIGVAAASLLIQSRSPAATSVPIVREDRPPASFVRAVDRDIPNRVVMFWKGGAARQGTSVLRRPLNVEELSALRARESELEAAIKPWSEASRDALFAGLFEMLGAYPPNQRHDQETAFAIAANYASTVRRYPLWAILTACTNIREGRAGFNLDYCPSEPRFSRYVAQLVEPYEQLLRQTRRLLSAEIEPPPPRKPTLAEIEAKLGRPLGAARSAQAKGATWPAPDGNHGARIMLELEARKARNMLQANSPGIAMDANNSDASDIAVATE